MINIIDIVYRTHKNYKAAEKNSCRKDWNLVIYERGAIYA